MSAAHLWLFFGLVFSVVILPGLDMAVVLGSALAGGRRAGLAAVGGLVAGGVCHVAAAASGLALVLTVVPAAFNALLVAGAAYVAWLGMGLCRTASLRLATAGGPATARRAFSRAVLTNLLNPKAYAFMLAIFPQFLRPEAGPVHVQALVLGGIIAATQGGVYGSVALGAARVRDGLGGDSPASRRLAQAVGVVLVLSAAGALMEGWRRG